MDRDLGAIQTPTNSTDSNALGYLYQFGRRTDGHQLRTSLVSSNQATGNIVLPPDTDKFLATSPLEWNTIGVAAISDLWNESNTGVNDVNWPSGFRLPTMAEWQAEIDGWGTNKADEAFAKLKLNLGGYKETGGSVVSVGSNASYHSATAGSGVLCLEFNNTTAGFINGTFTAGRSIRCIKI
jgi:hypothetical protein